MAEICLRGLRCERHTEAGDRCPDCVPPCAVVVLREDGIEPYRGLTIAYQQLWRLWVATQDERLVTPGHALLALRAGQCLPEEAATALRYAAEGSRWAPWIQAVEATVRANV